jgi:cytoskeleton protein RodZ
MGSEGSGNFGAKLRNARERKGVSLRQIATRTKISMAVLEALERNDIARLPGGIFSRAFVRSFANEVGLDPETTIQEFLSQFPHDSVTAGHPRSHQIEDTEMFESDRRMASSVLWMLIISIPLAAAVLYFSVSDKFRREEPPARPQAGRPAVGAQASPPGASSPTSARSATDGAASRTTSGPGSPAVQPPPASGAGLARTSGLSSAAGLPRAASPAAAHAPSSATPATSTASPAVSTPSTSSQQPAPGPTSTTSPGAGGGTPAPVDKLTVVLSARGPVWVSATVDGQKVIGRLLQTGDQQTVEVKRELVLTAGDAAAMRMVVNGVEARALGKAGEVVTTRVTLVNFRDYLPSR